MGQVTGRSSRRAAISVTKGSESSGCSLRPWSEIREGEKERRFSFAHTTELHIHESHGIGVEHAEKKKKKK